MKSIWRQPGDVTSIPAYNENVIASSAYLEDASFLRLKNLSLTYQLPQEVLRKTGFIKGVKISAITRNLWTLSKYTGFDPEYDGKIESAMYPNSRQYSLSLEITF